MNVEIMGPEQVVLYHQKVWDFVNRSLEEIEDPLAVFKIDPFTVKSLRGGDNCPPWLISFRNKGVPGADVLQIEEFTGGCLGIQSFDVVRIYSEDGRLNVPFKQEGHLLQVNITVVTEEGTMQHFRFSNPILG